MVCRQGYETEHAHGGQWKVARSLGAGQSWGSHGLREGTGCRLLSDFAAARGHTFALERLFLTVRHRLPVRGCERAAARLKGHRDNPGVIAVRPMITVETMGELEARGLPYSPDVRHCGDCWRAACDDGGPREGRIRRPRRRETPGGVISRNHAKAITDAADRASIPGRGRAATRHERQCARLPRPVPPLPQGDPQRSTPDKVKEGKRFDDVSVLRTNTDLNSLDGML
jgi:hypothetical protein